LVRAELDRYFLVDRREDLGERITLVHNERYASTDSAYALWLARFGVDESMLLVDGDVVFEEAALAALLAASSKSGAIAVARARGGDRPSVHVDPLGLVSRVTRELDGGLEAVGLAVLSRATLTHFFPALERRVITLDRAADSYEHAFDDLLAEGRLSMRAVNVEDFRCVAVDEPEDLDRARGSFENDPGTPALQ
jgi:choline kinase